MIVRTSSKKLLVLTLTCLLLCVIWYYITVINISRFGSKTAFLNMIDVQGTNKNMVSQPNCVSAKIKNLQFPICTHGDGDLVSKSFIQGKYWEAQSVKYIMSVMESDPRFIFIDLGSNIGAYTLAVAHMKRRVFAVEPNWATARLLSQSIARGNISDYVTLLNNAVSDEHTTVRMAQDHGNRGNTYLLNGDNCSLVDIGNCVPNSVKTITLDNDLLPIMPSNRAIIKIDIQGHEIRALSDRAARNFFTSMKIPVIVMEFEEYKKYHGNLEQRASVDKWLDFFYSLNYTIHHETSGAKLGKDWMRWTWDVVLKHEYDYPTTSGQPSSA